MSLLGSPSNQDPRWKCFERFMAVQSKLADLSMNEATGCMDHELFVLLLEYCLVSGLINDVLEKVPYA